MSLFTITVLFAFDLSINRNPFCESTEVIIHAFPVVPITVSHFQSTNPLLLLPLRDLHRHHIHPRKLIYFRYDVIQPDSLAF